jgi:hypothetical protein
MQSRIARSSFLPSLFFLSALSALLWAGSVSQHTEGSCSPAVADVKGNVTINCRGVDADLMNEMVKLLNEMLKDTKKLDQIKQDLDKTAKRTDRIEARQAARRLTQNQFAQIVKFLAGKSSAPVEIHTPGSDGEALQYARDLGQALASAAPKPK